MSILPIIRFGDPRLVVNCDRVPLVKAPSAADGGDVTQKSGSALLPTFVVPEDVKGLVEDLRATMAEASGAGIAAPQVGITRRVALFGTGAPNPRYPGAAIVPKSALINPFAVPLTRPEYEALVASGDKYLASAAIDVPVEPTDAVDASSALVGAQPSAADLNATIEKVIQLFDAADNAATEEEAAAADAAIVALAQSRSDAMSSAAVGGPNANSTSPHYMTGMEGCLSVPGIRGVVTRHRFIVYHGVCADTGLRVRRAACDFHARVFQHECDHLDGYVFPMRVTDWAKFGYTEELEQSGLLPPLPRK